MEKIFRKIKTFVKRVWRGAARAWNLLPDESRLYIETAVTVTQAVKDVIKEGTFTGSLLDTIVAKIPGKIDDFILQKLREYIPVLLIKLSLSQSILLIEDDEERLIAVIERVKLFDDDQKEAFWDAFAKKVLQYTSDGEISWSDANAIVKWYFDNKFTA